MWSQYFFIFPPVKPVKPIVFSPISFAFFRPSITFGELPDVEIAKAISPSLPKPSICLLNTYSNPISFEIDVITDESPVNEIPAKGDLSKRNLLINSPATCWLSAALPPLPKKEPYDYFQECR